MDPWPAVVTVGFVATTALVVVLARGSTARWERQRAAARSRRAAGPPAAPADGRLARLRAAGVRTGAVALHAAASLRRRVRTAGAPAPEAPADSAGTPVRRVALKMRSIARRGAGTGQEPSAPRSERPRRRSLRLPRPHRRRGSGDPRVSPGP